MKDENSIPSLSESGNGDGYDNIFDEVVDEKDEIVEEKYTTKTDCKSNSYFHWEYVQVIQTYKSNRNLISFTSQSLPLVGCLLEEYQEQIILCLWVTITAGGVLYLIYSPRKVINSSFRINIILI